MRKRFIVVKIQSSHISLSLRATVLRSIQICRSKHTKPILLEARGPLTRTCRSSSLPASPGAPALRSGQTYASSHPNPVPSRPVPPRHHRPDTPVGRGDLTQRLRPPARAPSLSPHEAYRAATPTIRSALRMWAPPPPRPIHRFPPPAMGAAAVESGGSRSPGRRCRPVITRRGRGERDAFFPAGGSFARRCIAVV